MSAIDPGNPPNEDIGNTFGWRNWFFLLYKYVKGISITGAILGTTTNDNAAVGYIGEYVESNISSSSAVSFTTNVSKNITSISLTAGDWDVFGMFGLTGGSVPTKVTVGTSTTSNTIGSEDSVYLHQASVNLTSNPRHVFPTKRYSLA